MGSLTLSIAASGMGFALLTAALVAAILRIKGTAANVITLWTFIFGQIVLLSEILSEFRAIGVAGFLIGHFVFLCLAGAAWYNRGSPSIIAEYQSLILTIRFFITHHKTITIFTMVIVTFVIVNLLFPIILPLYSPDAYAYHIPRAYMWEETGTARPYITNDFRQTQFPPNSSFLLMWIKILTGDSRFFHLPQWSAICIGTIALGGLIQQAGHSRPAAILSSLFFLTFPITIYQTATAQNDLLLAATALAWFYFAVSTLNAAARSERWWPNTLVAGMLFGLACGTKLTFAYFAIPASVGLAALGIYKLRSHLWQPFLGLTVASLVGFVLLGLYQYAINYATIGHPLFDERIPIWMEKFSTPENRNALANIVRTAYSTLDWVGIITGENPIILKQIEILRSLFSTFGWSIDTPPSFTDYRYLTNRPPSEASGYSVIVFPLLVISPLLAIILLTAAVYSKTDMKNCFVTSAIYLFSGYGSLFCTATLMLWDKTVLRYQIAGVVIIAVGSVLPWIYDVRLLRYTILAPLAFLAAYAASYTTFQMGGRQDPSTVVRTLLYDLPLEERLQGVSVPGAIRVIRDGFPPGATIGLVGHSDTPWFLFMQGAPALRFHQTAPQVALDAFREGRFAALLVDEDAFDVGYTREFHGLEHLMWRFPQTSDLRLILPDWTSIRLFVHEPERFLQNHLAEYGLRHIDNEPSSLAITSLLTLAPAHPKFWHARLRIAIPNMHRSDKVVALGLISAPDRTLPGEMNCGGVATPASLTRESVVLRIPASAHRENEIFLDCEWIANPPLLRIAIPNQMPQPPLIPNAFVLDGTGVVVSRRVGEPWPDDEALATLLRKAR
jgi:hypothetical protein